MQPSMEDLRLKPILEKVISGERLSFDDGVALYRSPDILSLGYMANIVRERLHGDKTYFNVTAYEPDRCVRGKLPVMCVWQKGQRPEEQDHVAQQVWETAGHGYSEAVTEFHIVGGLHPELTLDWFCEMIRGLKRRYSQVHLKAFTMVEIAYLAKRGKISIRERKS